MLNLPQLFMEESKMPRAVPSFTHHAHVIQVYTDVKGDVTAEYQLLFENAYYMKLTRSTVSRHGIIDSEWSTPTVTWYKFTDTARVKRIVDGTLPPDRLKVGIKFSDGSGGYYTVPVKGIAELQDMLNKTAFIVTDRGLVATRYICKVEVSK